jgi:lupus La protein
MLRSVYAKGFGQETSETHLAIEDFFRLYAQFKSIRLRRDKWGVFKGSVFVEFEDEKAQKDFLELDPKPEFDGTELKIMSKKDYVEWKNQGILDGTVRPRSPLGYNNRNNGFKKNNRGKFAKQRGKHGHKWEKKDGARNRDRRHRRDYDESRSRSRSRGDRRSRRDKDDVRSVSRSPAPHRNSDEGGDYRSRSRSRDRDREDRRGRYDRKTRRSSYKGDLDDWKARKDHEVKEKETKKRRRMDGEESEDEISKLSKKVKADE